MTPSSDLALARKWRPKSFATLVGQEHVIRALTHVFEQRRLHHAYLLTGTRGVGKTTIARIMAKALNCETGVSAAPCGTCSSCLEIDSGRFVDYIELDAASNRGVEDMTGLLEKAAYAPTRGRYKVYVIDEVHQLTGHAFNAMLKTLEEPPEHVKFILATTDPQKIPVTVLSRCLQFNLKQMPPAQIVSHLIDILGKESVPYEEMALRHLAKAAAGSMRDALSLLDQAIAHGAGKVLESDVRAMLGTVGDDLLYTLLDALQAGDIAALLRLADEMEASSLAFDAALQSLASLFHRIAIAQFAPQALADTEERERLSAYARAFSAEHIQLCYQIAVHARDELDLAPDEASGFRICLIRLFAFQPDQGTVRQEIKSAPVAALSSSPARKSATNPAQPYALDTVPARDAAHSPQHFHLPKDAEGWHTLAAQLPLSAMSRQLAQHCAWRALEGEVLRLILPAARRFLLAHQGKLEEEMRRIFGQGCRVQIDLDTTDDGAVVDTPAARNRDAAQERQEKALHALKDDPVVLAAQDAFGAEIDPASVRPL